jgi:hypothetical protein
MYFYQSSNCGCRRIYVYIFPLYVFLYNLVAFTDTKFFLEPLVEISYYTKVVVATEFHNFLVVCILIFYLIHNFDSNDAIVSKGVKGN